MENKWRIGTRRRVGHGTACVRVHPPPGSDLERRRRIGYLLPSSIDRLRWHRKALWSTYPEDHIGRRNGTAYRVSKHAPEKYREEPMWPWSEDMHDFFLQGMDRHPTASTNDFRSLKENVWYASCILGESGIRVRVESEAEVAVKASVEANGGVLFTCFNYWRFPELAWGNYYGVSGPPSVQEFETVTRLTDEVEKST